MKLEQMSMKGLLELHNKIADKPAGHKTFATRGKLVARIEAIAADKNIDVASFRRPRQPEAAVPSTQPQAEAVESPDAPTKTAEALRQAIIDGVLRDGGRAVRTDTQKLELRRRDGLAVLALTEEEFERVPADQRTTSRAVIDRLNAVYPMAQDAAPRPVRGHGIGALARQFLMDPAGYPHALIAAMVNAQVDGAQATDKSVRWYANQMRKKGIEVPPRQKAHPADMDAEQSAEAMKTVRVVEPAAED